MKLVDGSRALFRAALDLIAPARCAACDALTTLSAGYCDACGAPEPLLDVACHVEQVPVFAGARYAEPLVSALYRFKYGAAPELSRPLAALSARGIDLLGVEPGDVWVPVPLHPLRLAERGYNQSALLCREFARLVGGRMDLRRLERTRPTEQQAKRDWSGRTHNVRGAFAARSKGRTATTRVVLVDDVVTSGATLGSCIRALRDAGDQVLGCVAVAHATLGAQPATRIISEPPQTFWP